MNTQNIKLLCLSYDLHPSKSKGQNFLIDQNIVKKIISTANLSKSDLVLEVGPGLGFLTSELLPVCRQVWAVELDKKIIAFLQDNFKLQLSAGKLKLIEGDILQVDLRKSGLDDWSYKIVANLPYNITSQFFRRFLEFGPKPVEMIVMVQKEVALRMVAKPGEMNLLALSAQFFSQPEILFYVSRSCFWPEPAVDSAIIRLKLNKKMPPVDEKLFFRLARIGFSAKRKQLHNNLAGGLASAGKDGLSNEKIKKIFKDLGFREDIRAQDLNVDDWVNLTGKLLKFI